MRPLYQIAKEIMIEWPNVNYAARPYLETMRSLSDIGENCGADDGKTIVLYFLANAGTWRGESAKRIKAELRAMTK